jgi:inward rectifier potassium channel
VHALDDKSPVAGFTEADLQEAAAEFMVMVKGIDEANHQTVNARRSYNWEEMVWNARFSPVVSRNEKGQPYVMMQKIGEYSLV